ncbi:MAG: hypothetical protein Q9170_007718 [Blastenia crenularia]
MEQVERIVCLYMFRSVKRYQLPHHIRDVASAAIAWPGILLKQPQYPIGHYVDNVPYRLSGE